MKKINLETLFTEGLGYKETSWKGQRTKHLKAIGLEKEDYLATETWKELKTQLMTVKALQNKVMLLVIENFIEEPTEKEIIEKAKPKAKKEVIQVVRPASSEADLLRNKRLLDKIKELENWVNELRSENLALKLDIQRFENPPVKLDCLGV